jgi:hypothetical protein
LQHVDAALGGIGIAGNFQATIKFRLDEAWILDELDNLVPHDRIKQVLADRMIVTNRSTEMPVAIRSQATIIVDLARA